MLEYADPKMLVLFVGAHPNWRVAILALAGLAMAVVLLGWSVARLRAPGTVGGLGLLGGTVLAFLSFGTLVWAMDPLDSMGR